MAYKNRARKREYDRNWRRNHPEVSEAVRKWHKDHPDYQRKWREEHRDEFNKYHRSYNASHKGYYAEWKKGLAARGLRLQGYVKPDGKRSLRLVSIKTGLPVKGRKA